MGMLHAERNDAKNGNGAVWLERRLKEWGQDFFDESRRSAHLQGLKEKSLKRQITFDRTVQFWTRTISIYASYKATQARVQFVKDKEEQHRIWEEQHERAAEKIYSLCVNLGGFFLKTAQLLAKPDLAPTAWVKKLVVLCDGAPETPYDSVLQVVESELRQPFQDVFESFEKKPIGSASVAQVHRARLRGATNDVAVKVQHPGAEELMMTDIRNQKAFAAFIQRVDVQFDMLSVVDELEQQVAYEFNFNREADSMTTIAEALEARNHGKSPVIVPRPVAGLVTKRVLVMDFIEGTPILHMGEEMKKRGISPNGIVAKLAKRSIMNDLSLAYGQMILGDGFFQADPHPGNILITKQGKVALLDYGQTKDLPKELRCGFAKLVIGLATDDALAIGAAFKELGIETSQGMDTDPKAFKTLAKLMFDTKLPPGMITSGPFDDDTVLKQVGVKKFPQDLFFVIRTVHLLRGLSVGMDVPYSSSEQWRALAKEAIVKAGNSYPASVSAKDVLTTSSRDGLPKELVWEKKRRLRRGRLQADT